MTDRRALETNNGDDLDLLGSIQSPISPDHEGTATHPRAHATDEAPPPALGRAAARGVGITLISQLLRTIIQFGSLIVLARLLNPTDFGIVASVTAIIGVADVIRDFGLSSAAIQSRTLTDDERTNLFWVNTLIGITCAFLIVVGAPLIDRLYHAQLYSVTLSLAGLFVLSGANTQFNAELARQLRFHALSISEVSAQALSAATGISLAVAGAGYWAIVAQNLVLLGAILVFNVVLCRWRPGLPKKHVSIRRFFRFGMGVLGTQLIAYATRNVDNVTVGAARGTVELGFYSRAYQLLVTPLNVINTPMTRVALPVLSRVQDDDVMYARYLRRAQLVGCYLTATLLAVACGLASPIVHVLFGSRWTAVIPIFAILAVGGVFRAVEQISYWMYLSRGKTGAQLRLYLFTRPLMIAMIIGGIPWGAVGVATTSSIAYFLYWIVSLITAGRATSVDVRPLFAKAAQAILFVSAPCGIAGWCGTLVSDNVGVQLGAGLAFVLAYLAFVILSVRRIRDDVMLVRRFASQAVGR